MIGTRIREERTRLDLNQPDFGAIASASKRTVIEWEKDNSSPTAMQLAALSEAGVDVSYVVTGVRSGTSTSEQYCDQKKEFGIIPVYDIEVSAGDGRVAYGETPLYHFAYRKDWLASRGLHEKDLHVVMARGDSMEPTISDGESLLVNTAENEPKDGHVYVIRSGETLWVKHVQILPNNVISLISDNKVYAPIHIDLDASSDVQIIGKVVNSSKNFY